jgi:L-asparaginase/Glu-tRNA(Gln) amidotransferase subunit D
MSQTSGPVHLNNHHRDTLVSIFQHRTSHNIDWKAVESLLEVVGTVVQTGDDKFHVQIGEEQEVFIKPRHKDLDTQQIVDLRRMLTNAGYAGLVEETTGKGKEV